MLESRKRYFVLTGLVVLLVFTGYLNYTYNNAKKTTTTVVADTVATATPSPSVTAKASATATVKASPSASSTSTSSSVAGIITGDQTTSSSVTTFKEERDASRVKELQYLNEIINNTNTDAETLKDAQEQKMAIAVSMEKEVTIQGLLETKGYSNPTVTIHTGSINVLLTEKSITSQQAAQILDIVERETSESAQNIKIIPSE